MVEWSPVIDRVERSPRENDVFLSKLTRFSFLLLDYIRPIYGQLGVVREQFFFSTERRNWEIIIAKLVLRLECRRILRVNEGNRLVAEYTHQRAGVECVLHRSESSVLAVAGGGSPWKSALRKFRGARRVARVARSLPPVNSVSRIPSRNVLKYRSRETTDWIYAHVKSEFLDEKRTSRVESRFSWSMFYRSFKFETFFLWNRMKLSILQALRNDSQLLNAIRSWIFLFSFASCKFLPMTDRAFLVEYKFRKIAVIGNLCLRITVKSKKSRYGALL